PHVHAGRRNRHRRARPRQAARLREEGETAARHVHPRVDRRSGQVHREGLSAERDAEDVRKAPRAAVELAHRLPGITVRLTLQLPADFPRDVSAIACDLDRTLIGEDVQLRPRTREAIARVRVAGARFILVTGRMFQAVQPYALEAKLDDPMICYQGAV